MNDSQIVLENSREPYKLSIIRKKLSKKNGGIYEGTLPSIEWSRKILGQTYNKVIIASKGVDKLNDINEITAIGGWCAVRTKCLKDISQGIVNDPLTGIDTKIQSIDELTSWIQKAVSADQIVESIGIYQGTKYVAISEETLWSEKVGRAIENYFGRKLTTTEESSIKKSLQIAEHLRFQATKKYIEYIKKEEIDFKVITDTDIFQELIEGRDFLLNQVGLKLVEMSNAIISNRINDINIEEDRANQINRDMLEYVDRSSLVWFMYTGPYLQILKAKGVVNTKYGIIIEPWSHSVSNEAESIFNDFVFGKNHGENNYLEPSGLNENIAYVAIDEVSQYNFKKSKITTSISKVPNLNNHNHLVSKLRESNTLSSLDLRFNDAFIMGANYMPYNETLKKLSKMIETRNNYQNERSNLKKREAKSEAYQKLRDDYSKILFNLSNSVIDDLEHLFKTIFSDLKSDT